MEDKPKKPKVKKPRKPRVGQKQKQTQIVTVNVSTHDKPKPKRKPRAKPKPKTAPPSASFGLPSTFGGAGGLTAGQPFRQVIYAPSQDVRTSIQSLEKSIATLSQAGGSQRGGDEPPLFAVGDIRDQSFKSKSRSSEESFSDETQTQMGDDDDYQRSSLSGAAPQLKKAGLTASRKPGYSNLSPVEEEEDDDESRVARGQRESTIAGLPTQEQNAQLKAQLADKAKRKKAGKPLRNEETGEIYTRTLSRSEVNRRLDREAAISREQRLRTELAEEPPEPLGEQGGGAEFI